MSDERPPDNKDWTGSMPKALGLIVQKSAMWPANARLRVSFNYIGSHNQYTKAKLEAFFTRYADVWMGRTNLSLRFVSPNDDADIRVLMDFEYQKDSRSSSGFTLVGCEALKGKKSEPTMRLNIGSSAVCQDIMELMYHELGHALGFLHEHSHPNRPARCFNTCRVYELWGVHEPDISQYEADIRKQFVDTNILYQSDPTKVECSSTQWDTLSVMMYEMKPDYLKDGPGDVPQQRNLKPSEQDLDAAAQYYPRCNHETRSSETCCDLCVVELEHDIWRRPTATDSTVMTEEEGEGRAPRDPDQSLYHMWADFNNLLQLQSRLLEGHDAALGGDEPWSNGGWMLPGQVQESWGEASLFPWQGLWKEDWLVPWQILLNEIEEEAKVWFEDQLGLLHARLMSRRAQRLLERELLEEMLRERCIGRG